MLFSDSYFTVERRSEAVFRDRGSRFIGMAMHVGDESDIRRELKAIEQLHPSAAHLCYAWVLGPGGTATRANDDREPSGTAGRPILARIKADDLTDTLVVVVRYFGGTLLGVNGLIHAYREAARLALEQAGRREMFVEEELELTFDPVHTGDAMQLLRRHGANILSTGFDIRTIVRCRLRRLEAQRLQDAIASGHFITYKTVNNQT